MKKRTWSYYRYLKSLLSTPDPLRQKKRARVIYADYPGLIAYARKKGVEVSNLSLEEKERFVKISM